MAIPGYEPDEVFEDEAEGDDADVEGTDPAAVDGEGEELMGEVGEESGTDDDA